MHQRWRYYGQILHSLWKEIHLSRGFAPSLKAVLKSDICPRGVLVSEGTICYSIGGLKQNAGLILTPVYDTFFLVFHMVTSVTVSMGASTAIF